MDRDATLDDMRSKHLAPMSVGLMFSGCASWFTNGGKLVDEG